MIRRAKLNSTIKKENAFYYHVKQEYNKSFPLFLRVALISIVSILIEPDY